MHPSLIPLLLAVACFAGCNKPAGSSPSENGSPQTAKDHVEQKLIEYAGSPSTNCGRLNVQAATAQLQAASSCAMQASKDHRPFYVAYDMPGMTVAVAGNSEGKLFSVKGDGTGPGATVTSGECPSQLRIAASGRINCFAPGEMGVMGPGHGSAGIVGGGMVNPHTGGSPMPPSKKP